MGRTLPLTVTEIAALYMSLFRVVRMIISVMSCSTSLMNIAMTGLQSILL